jgi:hypothetical protein
MSSELRKIRNLTARLEAETAEDSGLRSEDLFAAAAEAVKHAVSQVADIDNSVVCEPDENEYASGIGFRHVATCCCLGITWTVGNLHIHIDGRHGYVGGKLYAEANLRLVPHAELQIED